MKDMIYIYLYLYIIYKVYSIWYTLYYSIISIHSIYTHRLDFPRSKMNHQVCNQLLQKRNISNQNILKKTMIYMREK